jgi:outer membrane protein assembly factor BamB/tRNA A-37 threonylcarbamoyl transferase component Bud32
MDPLAADDPREIGEFRLRARLGAGGMGRVYLGFSPGGRAVAVKVIHPHLARDPAFAGRFRREVAAARAVNAVYAAPVVAAGPDDDPPWLATAFVPGPSLQDVVAAAGPLPEAAVVRLTAGLAEALRAIHAAGLVHRDLKPANVLLALDGPRVIDFGIARALDGTALTSADSVLGTPSFMSPEQASGLLAGQASDVFSLGGVTYYAATGRVPFQAEVAAAMLYRIVHTEPVLEHVPPGLHGLVAACLAKDPALRPRPERLAAELGSPAALDDPPGTFWPTPVVRLIRAYQAELPRADNRDEQRDRRQPPTRPAQRPPAKHAGQVTPAELRRRRVLTGMVGVAAAGLAAGAWELTRSGPSPTPAPKSVEVASRPGAILWRSPTDSSVSAVALAAGVVYAASDADTVYALDAATGKPLWRRVVPGALGPQLALARDAVVIASTNGLQALHPGTGEPLWSANPAPSFELPVAAAGDAVYAGFTTQSAGTAVTAGVTALKATTGGRLWTYQLPFFLDDETTGLAVSGDVVYVTTESGGMAALDTVTGRQLWAVTIGYPNLGPPVVTDGIIYVSPEVIINGETGIYAVRAASGAVLWHRALSGGAYMAAVAEGVVFVPVSGGLAALNGASGEAIWRVQVDGGVHLPPAAAGNVVYSASTTGVLDAWQATTGNKIWSTSAAPVFSNIILAWDMAYVGSGDHDVYALAV